MVSPKRLIEVDEATAENLQARATARGMSVAQLVAQLAAVEIEESREIAELDRRWAAMKSGGAAASNEQVVRWLHTWGTPQFRPWHEQ